MSRGSIARFTKPNGEREVRILFRVWIHPELGPLHMVSVFPHLCSTCAGGDHTHVEMDDYREPDEILSENTVCLSLTEKAAIDEYLMRKHLVNQLTSRLAEHTQAFA